MKKLMLVLMMLMILLMMAESKGIIKKAVNAVKNTASSTAKNGQGGGGAKKGGKSEAGCSRRGSGGKGGQIGAQVGTKIAGRIASAVAGPTVGAAFGGVTMALGFIGDAVQRDKCKLRCCPDKGLPSVWGCKYQPKHKCNGHYSDYPGHGDHACWWNEAEGRCETGVVCRDKTFSFFALVGSVCPPCPDQPCWEPQFNKAALKKLGMPERFYVDPRKEFEWCAPNGVPSCNTVRNQKKCETSYADHKGDQNCIWRNGRCLPGPKCDNSRQRLGEAKSLGIQYYGSTWRRNGIPLSGSAPDYNHNKNRQLANAPIPPSSPGGPALPPSDPNSFMFGKKAEEFNPPSDNHNFYAKKEEE